MKRRARSEAANSLFTLHTERAPQLLPARHTPAHPASRLSSKAIHNGRHPGTLPTCPWLNPMATISLTILSSVGGPGGIGPGPPPPPDRPGPACAAVQEEWVGKCRVSSGFVRPSAHWGACPKEFCDSGDRLLHSCCAASNSRLSHCQQADALGVHSNPQPQLHSSVQLLLLLDQPQRMRATAAGVLSQPTQQTHVWCGAGACPEGRRVSASRC